MSTIYVIVTLFAVEPTTQSEALIEYGRQIGVQSILSGQVHEVLQRLAQEQANYCAAHRIQGHQLWNRQFQDHYREYPGLRSIVAESFPGRTLEDGIKECFHSWHHSKGHWEYCNGRCRYYGFAIARGTNGVWYACGIFSN